MYSSRSLKKVVLVAMVAPLPRSKVEMMRTSSLNGCSSDQDEVATLQTLQHTLEQCVRALPDLV